MVGGGTGRFPAGPMSLQPDPMASDLERLAAACEEAEAVPAVVERYSFLPTT